MKKKLVMHAIQIAKGNADYRFPYQYPSGNGGVYITDAHRILETEAHFEGVEINYWDKSFAKMMSKFIEKIGDWDLAYDRHELPDKATIKEGITELVGRKLTDVVWSDGLVTLNARYLMKAMDALNATVCYVSNSPKEGIFLFENDDMESFNREIILPICNTDDKVGFWIK